MDRLLPGHGSKKTITTHEDQQKDVPWLCRGSSQNIVVGLIALCCPGIFNAMQGLGGAGGDDPNVANAMNVALYTTFAVFGVFGGMLFNLFGNRGLLCFGGLTYVGYAVGVYLWGTDESFAPVAIFAAAMLGLGAACLWTAQGAMTVSYATDDEKGTFTAVFWIIFNFGAMMGGLITMVLQWSGQNQSGVSPVTYFAFCGMMLSGCLIALVFVKEPGSVVRKDGTRIELEPSKGPLEETKSALAVFTDKKMLLLFPLIIQSNWFYTYEFNGVNGSLFNARTRGLNSAIYWGMQMISALVVGNMILDSPRMTPRRRATVGLVAIGGFNLLQWIYAAWMQYRWSVFYNYQDDARMLVWDKDNSVGGLTGPSLNLSCTVDYSGADACVDGQLFGPLGSQLIDVLDFDRWWVPGLLFISMGLADAAVQTYAYWIMGSIADGPTVLSRYVGYYKGVQAFGAAIAWALDLFVTYRTQMWICFVWAVVFPVPALMVATSVGSVKDRSASLTAPASKVDVEIH